MYEAPEIINMGVAHELIQGNKPFLLHNVDSDSVPDRDDKDTDDIDEVDE